MPFYWNSFRFTEHNKIHERNWRKYLMKTWWDMSVAFELWASLLLCPLAVKLTRSGALGICRRKVYLTTCLNKHSLLNSINLNIILTLGTNCRLNFLDFSLTNKKKLFFSINRKPTFTVIRIHNSYSKLSVHNHYYWISRSNLFRIQIKINLFSNGIIFKSCAKIYCWSSFYEL